MGSRYSLAFASRRTSTGHRCALARGLAPGMEVWLIPFLEVVELRSLPDGDRGTWLGRAAFALVPWRTESAMRPLRPGQVFRSDLRPGPDEQIPVPAGLAAEARWSSVVESISSTMAGPSITPPTGSR